MHLHPGFGPLTSDHGQEALGNIAMNQKTVEGIAYRGALHLGVVGDGHRLIQIGAAIDIGMANANAAGKDGHDGVLGDQCHQSLTTTRDDEVDSVLHLQHLVHQRPLRGLDELHHILEDPRLFNGFLYHLDQRPIGAQRLLAPAQDDRIARLEAKGGDVNGNIGAAFIDDADNPQGDPPPLDMESIGKHPGIEGLTHGVGEGGNGAHILSHGLKPGRGEEQPVEHGLAHPAGLGLIAVEAVGLKYLPFP